MDRAVSLDSGRRSTTPGRRAVMDAGVLVRRAGRITDFNLLHAGPECPHSHLADLSPLRGHNRPPRRINCLASALSLARLGFLASGSAGAPRH